MKQFLVFLLGFSFVPLVSAGERELVIPRSSEEMEELLEDKDGACNGCGIVTNVRQQAPAIGQDPPKDDPYTFTLFEATRAGPGDDVKVTNFLDPMSEIQERNKPSAGVWLVTVRSDDGSYAVHEQDIQPSVRKGDRVQLISGRLVPR